jgi:antitoxin component YwqK of YwqJK toxin-antitoxin module
MVLYDPKPKSQALCHVIQSLINEYIFKCFVNNGADNTYEYLTIFGTKYGPERLYNTKSGILIEEIWNNDDNKIVHKYYHDGSLKSIKRYYRGKLHGRSYSYRRNDKEPRIESNYKHGHLISYKFL